MSGLINRRINAPLSGPPPGGVSPILTSAFKFNGKASRILSSASADYGLQANFEFAALVKVDAGRPFDQTIFGKYGPPGSPTPDGWRFMFRAAPQAFSLSVADSSLPNEENCESVHIDLNRWYVIRGNHDGGLARVVVNGVETIDGSLAPGVSSEPFLVGGPVGARFYGQLSKLTIWDRLLTDVERAAVDGVATNWPFRLE